jgi:hypothetical protein
MGVWKYQGSPLSPAQLRPDTPRFDTGLGIITQGIINPSYDILELFREGDKMKYKDFKWEVRSLPTRILLIVTSSGRVQQAPSVGELWNGSEWMALTIAETLRRLKAWPMLLPFLDFDMLKQKKSVPTWLRQKRNMPRLMGFLFHR